MSSVDKRIVEMVFNNSQFESGVKTSVSTLDKLKQSLNLSGSAKGLDDLSKAGSKVNLSGLSAGIEAISDKFSMMGIIGITALQNITNSAMNAGKKIISALTIDPIKTGFQEYETKMGAIQTIMTNTASKGTTLEDVNRVLGELNEYSDKTIYNFAEMAKNIGTFTAAGIGIDESAAAIKGIANLAAGSGSTSAQASTAMYQLSQAMAAGSVKLQDWNSVVNAGMGGELFQNALKDQAKSMGIYVDESVPFRESLKDGWINAEVLTATLGKMADDEALVKAATEVKTFTQLYDTMQESVQSGWGVSWEHIIGNKAESTELLTEISQAFEAMIGPGADARNAMLEFWSANGGRTAMIDGIKNALSALSNILKPVSEGFREIFPAMTGEKLVEMSKGFKDFTEKLKVSGTMGDNIKNTFKGLFAVIDIGKDAFSALVKALVSVVKFFLPVGDGLLGLTGSFGEFLVSLRDIIKETGFFNAIFETIGKILGPVAKVIKSAIDGIVTSFKGLSKSKTGDIDEFGNRVEKGFAPIKTISGFVVAAFDKISEAVEKMKPVLKTFASSLGSGLGTAAKKISGMFQGFSVNKGLDIFNTGMFAAILVGLQKFIKSLTVLTGDSGSILGGIKNILGGVTGAFEGLQSSLKADALMKIAIAIGILAVALTVLSMIPAEKLGSSLLAISILFTELFVAMSMFQKSLTGAGIGKIVLISGAMIAMSIAALILAAAVSVLARLDWDELAKGLTGLAGLLAMLVISAKALSTSTGTLIKGAGGLVIFALAIVVLASAVKKLGELDTGTMIQGLIGVGVLITGLVLFINNVNLDGVSVLKGAGVLLLAVALNVLASAVKKLGEIDIPTLIKGLVSLGILLAEIAIFLNMTGDATKVMATAAGLLVLAAAMIVMASAVEKFGTMDTMVLVQGLIALAASLTIMGVAMHFMQGAIGGAAAIMVMAVALNVLVPAIEKLGNMSVGEIVQGLLALVGVFTVLGVAGLLLGPMVPIILALTGALALLGIGIALIGGGILMLATGFGMLAVAGAAGTAQLVLSVTALLGLIPMFLEQVANGVIAFARVIGEGAPAIVLAVANILVAIADAIILAAPKVAAAAVVLLKAMVDAIVQAAPVLGEGVIKALVGLFKGMLKAVKDLLGIKSPSTVFRDIASDLIQGLINGIKAKISEVGTWAGKIATTALDGVKNLAGDFLKVGKDIVDGMVKGLKSKWSSATTAMSNLGSTLLSAIKKKLQIASPSRIMKTIGKNVGEGLVIGVHAMNSKVFDEGGSLGAAVTTGAAQGLRKLTTIVVDEAENVGKKTINALAKTMANVSDLIDADMSLTPTIRPVIDLTDVENGLSSTFDQARHINANNTRGQATQISATNARHSNTIPITTTQSADGAISNSFVVHAVIREESDIKKVSQELFKLQQQNNRGRGVLA